MTIEWQEVTLGQFCELKRGYDLPKSNRGDGVVPVVSSSGVSGFHSEAKVQAPGVVTGRYGTLGAVFYLEEDFWPLNTSLYVRDFKGNNPRFVAALLESMHLEQHDGAAAVPGLNRNQLHELKVWVPKRPIQDSIACILQAIDELSKNTGLRVEILEEIARSIYREWFVYYRYPGHEHDDLVRSQLGPIPEGWDVKTVESLASKVPNAVTGGPFGSKLGRKDYVSEGVPVIRGTNLRLGGGFDESGLVFVSDETAEDLKSSLAKRGDVIITQRGTLGQIGLIPNESTFDRYVLSQSQMKITVYPSLTSPEFVYSQFRTPETTQRFISQGMSAGVPHVNLQLLRSFELVNPPMDLQERFTTRVRELDRQSWNLSSQIDRLSTLRDMLLPKLVQGKIDVSSLDLDVLRESAVA